MDRAQDDAGDHHAPPLPTPEVALTMTPQTAAHAPAVAEAEAPTAAPPESSGATPAAAGGRQPWWESGSVALSFYKKTHLLS